MFSEIPLRTPQELLLMREAGRITALVLEQMKSMAAVGISTKELDAAAEEIIRSHGAKPAFKGYRVHGKPPFPATICVSIDEEVVHGVPGDRKLKEGELVSIDVGVEHQGFFGDAATTIAIGKVSPKAKRLLDTCKKSLELAIAEIKPGVALSKIGETVQRHVESQGFSVVRDFVGHGIGTVMHQPPEVPNYKTDRGGRVILKPGLVIAVEPMITAGGWQVSAEDDTWPVKTADGSLAAHFEHTIAVTPEGHQILTLP